MPGRFAVTTQPYRVSGDWLRPMVEFNAGGLLTQADHETLGLYYGEGRLEIVTEYHTPFSPNMSASYNAFLSDHVEIPIFAPVDYPHVIFANPRPIYAKKSNPLIPSGTIGYLLPGATGLHNGMVYTFPLDLVSGDFFPLWRHWLFVPCYYRPIVESGDITLNGSFWRYIFPLPVETLKISD
jgi:hypothetical protein